MFIIQLGAGRYVSSVHFIRDSVLDIPRCSVDHCTFAENALLFTTKEHAQALRDLLPHCSAHMPTYRVIKAPD